MASDVKENVEKMGTSLVEKFTSTCRQIKQENDLNNNQVNKFNDLKIHSMQCGVKQ